MKRCFVLFLISIFLVLPVSALEAPVPPGETSAIVPPPALSFGQGVQKMLRAVIPTMRPDVSEAMGVCTAIMASAVLVSLVGGDLHRLSAAANLCGIACISTAFLSSAHSLILLGASTARELQEYGKLLLPVMTTALAATGHLTTSAALYAATAMFNTVLGSFLISTMMPMLYFYLAVCISAGVTGEKLLKNLKKEFKTFLTWSLKTILTVFTAYLGITGVVSGTTDAAALKATKTAISAFVPVVGGVLSEASESVLVSASMVKNSVGIYGIYAILAIFLKPFLRIFLHYFLLRISAAICSLFTSDCLSELVEDFSSVLAVLLGLTGALCVILFISCVCFLRGSGL